MSGEPSRVRDFVYLDVERLKSILAQVDEGYLEQTAKAAGSTETIGAGAEAQVPFLAKLGGTGQYVSTNQATETRTLHDHIYNYVETRLAEAGRLLILNDQLSAEDWLSDGQRQSIPSSAFILVRGRPIINDFAYMKNFLTNFNTIAGAIGRLPVYQSTQELTKAQAKGALDAAAKQLQLNKDLVNDLKTVLEAFVRNDLIVKIMPFTDQESARVVANLDMATALRTRNESLVYRFGSAPKGVWTLFGQVAAVPLSTDEAYQFAGALGAEIDNALQKLFNVLRTFETHIGSVIYPEISVVPIALYRE